MITELNINTILGFMPKSQGACFIDGLKGEESKYFEDVAKDLTKIIETAPKLYETENLKEDEIKPILHYFYGNMDLYITEIDTSGCKQHFGYTSLGMGYFEAGYISLDYLFDEIPLLNLDYHFEAKTLAEYRKKYEK